MTYEHACISIFHCLYFEKEIHLLMINISTIWDEKIVSDCIGTGYLFHRGPKSALGFICDVDNNLKPRLILTRVE